MRPRSGNLFTAVSAPPTGEAFEELLRLAVRGGPPGSQVRIERIISSASPEPVLYDQPQDEWVVLLQGRARLWIDGGIARGDDAGVDGVDRVLGPGDWLYIPAHTQHRVIETSAAPVCVWLAVHIGTPED